ncbi:MAG: Fe-S cluster assembly protein IscX [Phycisphaerales bacterium]|nr:Fe-S cluster assembly protein IscX [Phycisphaerales bacterium]
MMDDTFHWLDVDRIGEELREAYPGLDPLTVSFVELRRLVTELDGFQEEEGSPVNERILEAIQMIWHDEREDAD